MYNINANNLATHHIFCGCRNTRFMKNKVFTVYHLLIRCIKLQAKKCHNNSNKSATESTMLDSRLCFVCVLFYTDYTGNRYKMIASRFDIFVCFWFRSKRKKTETSLLIFCDHFVFFPGSHYTESFTFYVHQFFVCISKLFHRYRAQVSHIYKVFNMICGSPILVIVLFNNKMHRKFPCT